MKQYLPYNALMVVAVVFAGIAVFYNLALRESFSVLIRYTMPAAPKPQQMQEDVIIKTVGEREEADEDGFEGGPQSWDFADEPELTSVTFPIDINKATYDELCFIPQVGNVTAQRIVQYREVLGGYTGLEQLMEIKGIGEAAFERIAAYLYIEENE